MDVNNVLLWIDNNFMHFICIKYSDFYCIITNNLVDSEGRK